MNDSYLNCDESIILLLKKFIIKQIEKERQLTQKKIELILKLSFNKIFSFFSQNNNLIKPENIANIFDSLDIKNIRKIFEIYDKDKDSFLNFKEFYYFIFPKYIDINIDEMRENNKKNLKDEEISSKQKNKLYKIFQIEIQNINDSSLLMKKLINNINNSMDLNIYLYLFELIKGNDKKYDYLNEYININDILKFLNKNNKGIKIYEQDIANFIYRYDFENNLKINLEEFTNMINYFLTDENNEKKSYNFLNDIKTRNKLFFDYSTLEINNSNGSQINNFYNHNSFINTISLSNQENNDEIVVGSNGKGNININLAINFKEKELRDLKLNLLKDYFKLIIRILDDLEISKNQIVQILNPKELFSLFDIKNNSNINIDNFISVFNDYFDMKFCHDDFIYLMKKYDKNKDDKLNFEEFNFMISPISKDKLQDNEGNLKSNSKNINMLNEEQKNVISKLFKKLINCEKTIDIEKKKLIDVPLFSYYEIFEFIRNKENKLLNSEDIFYFLKNNNVIIQNEQFDILLNYLFFSTEKNKSYNFVDFIKILL